jgi:amidase
VSTWITRLDAAGDGIRLAVKDAIDVEGVPTTAGCAAVADAAQPAAVDAACVRVAREQGARIVGKTNLHELCFGTAGTNPWYGDPVNPLDASLVPGGSSSGSAVAVAVGEADVALGTDTGGSIRVPAACCGVVGLKTTWGRVPLHGVWPLAPTLDTVGPIARDVEGVVAGMRLLERGFAPAPAPAGVIGRVRFPGIVVDPGIDADIDTALATAGFDVVDVDLAGLAATSDPFGTIIHVEAWAADGHLFAHAERIGVQVRGRLEHARTYDPAAMAGALAARDAWRAELRAVISRVELLAMPTLAEDPPALGADGVMNAHLFPWNLAGVPAISLPVGGRRPVPSSLQLIGPWGREELLCATAAVVAGEQ